MQRILDLHLKKGQYKLTDAARSAARAYIEDSNTTSIAFGNARGVRNIFEKLLTEQANRLAALENVTREQLMEITEADVLAARAADTQFAKAQREREQAKAATQQALDTLRELNIQIKHVFDALSRISQIFRRDSDWQAHFSWLICCKSQRQTRMSLN